MQGELDDIQNKVGIDVATQTGDAGPRRRSLVTLSAEIAHDMSKTPPSATGAAPAVPAVPGPIASAMGLTRRGSNAGSLAASLSRMSVGPDMASLLDPSLSSTSNMADELSEQGHARPKLTRRGSTAGSLAALPKFSIGPDLSAELAGAMGDASAGTPLPSGGLTRRGSTANMAAFRGMTIGPDLAAEVAGGMSDGGVHALGAEGDSPRAPSRGSLTRRGSTAAGLTSLSGNFSVGPDMAADVASAFAPSHDGPSSWPSPRAVIASQSSASAVALPAGLSRRASNLGSMAASLSKMMVQQSASAATGEPEEQPSAPGSSLPSLTGAPSSPQIALSAWQSGKYLDLAPSSHRGHA